MLEAVEAVVGGSSLYVTIDPTQLYICHGLSPVRSYACIAKSLCSLPQFPYAFTLLQYGLPACSRIVSSESPKVHAETTRLVLEERVKVEVLHDRKVHVPAHALEATDVEACTRLAALDRSESNSLLRRRRRIGHGWMRSLMVELRL